MKIEEQVRAYSSGGSSAPLFLVGDSIDVLRAFPPTSVDCCMTSPPYWGHREYESAGLGAEKTPDEYIVRLLTICDDIRRVLAPTGSFWLNLGDAYVGKSLLGLPWRVALGLLGRGWLLRNEVVWHKVKGCPNTAKDRLRTVHEQIFHLVRNPTYYYAMDEIRSAPKKGRVVDGSVVSATGVRGVRYRRQIESSTVLSAGEKQAATAELGRMLHEISDGRLADFRMIIRGQQRVTHSDSPRMSGRARELAGRGFYFLKYHPNGAKPGDVWNISPEDTQKRKLHFAPYPEDLCRIPILATCPKGGIVLDPFCGTGTTNLAARRLDRKSIGIDISKTYIRMAEERCGG